MPKSTLFIRVVKKAYNKKMISLNYTQGEITWLNNKYIKIKKNKKLDNKFLGLFYIYYIVKKLVYELKLSIK